MFLFTIIFTLRAKEGFPRGKYKDYAVYFQIFYKGLWKLNLRYQNLKYSFQIKARRPVSAGNYVFKINNRETRKRCYRRTYFTPCSNVSIVNFEQVNADWLGTELMMIQPISVQYSISIPFENVRKPGVQKWDIWLKWLNLNVLKA